MAGCPKSKARSGWSGLSFWFGFGFWKEFLNWVFHGTTACEKPLFPDVVFVFEHFFYSGATGIL
jgi:hypothetical protein